MTNKNISLSVNLNKVALIRNSRDGNYPDVAAFGKLCLDTGAAGLTVHPRPDQRHIRPGDVQLLRNLVANYQHAEFNIEGNPFAPTRGDYPGLISLAETTRPHQCTLVPDSDGQKTSDHGFDLTKDFEAVAEVVKTLKGFGIRVSVFMDPDPEQIALVKPLGADRIELYTGPFAHAYSQATQDGERVFQQHCQAAKKAIDLGIGINAGHDLNLHNMALYRQLPGLEEVSIGHALTVDSLIMGFETAVKKYLAMCN